MWRAREKRTIDGRRKKGLKAGFQVVSNSALDGHPGVSCKQVKDRYLIGSFLTFRGTCLCQKCKAGLRTSFRALVRIRTRRLVLRRLARRRPIEHTATSPSSDEKTWRQSLPKARVCAKGKPESCNWGRHFRSPDATHGGKSEAGSRRYAFPKQRT